MLLEMTHTLRKPRFLTISNGTGAQQQGGEVDMVLRCDCVNRGNPIGLLELCVVQLRDRDILISGLEAPMRKGNSLEDIAMAYCTPHEQPERIPTLQKEGEKSAWPY